MEAKDWAAYATKARGIWVRAGDVAPPHNVVTVVGAPEWDEKYKRPYLNVVLEGGTSKRLSVNARNAQWLMDQGVSFGDIDGIRLTLQMVVTQFDGKERESLRFMAVHRASLPSRA